MKKFAHNASDESENGDNEASSVLSSSTTSNSTLVQGGTKRSKFKPRLTVVQWVRGHRRNEKTKSAIISAPPCCGLSTANDKEIQTEKQFSDKSVQCDELTLAGGGNSYRSQHSTHQGTTTDSINERLDIINGNPRSTHHEGCSCCCLYYGMEPPMHGGSPLRSPLYDARRRSLDQSNAISVFRCGQRPASLTTGSDISSDPRLFRKNNLISLGSDSEVWKNNINRMVRSDVQLRTENRFGSTPMLNCVGPTPEDRSFSKKSAQRKIGRVSPFVAPREEDEKEGSVDKRGEGTMQKDVSAELEQQAYLVLGINNQARRPFRRKICTPFSKRITMPPEHFKQWPSESNFEVDSDHHRLLPVYTADHQDAIPNMSKFQRNNMCPQSHHNDRYRHPPPPPSSSAIDSNSIMFRSNADDLYNLNNLADFKDAQIQKKLCSNLANPDANETNRFSAPVPNGSSLYSRLSGSIQNLFISSRGQSGPVAAAGRVDFSKSENNLNELSRRKAARDRLFFFGSRGKVPQRRANNFLTSGGGSFFTYNYDDEEESKWKKYFSFNMNLLRKHKKKLDAIPEPKR